MKRLIALFATVALMLIASTPVLGGGSSTMGKLGDFLGNKREEGDMWDKVGEGLNKIRDISEKHDEVYKDVKELSKNDKDYDPDYDLPGSPQLPSLCIGSKECEACFKDPYARLNETRYRFEKLRKVNKVTKTMLRDSISFGDAAASAAGGLAPLAWSKEKQKIRASEKNFNAAYDAKYDELLGTLHESLLGISECEEKMFGDQDWYDRFGFIYHQFMATAYRRPD